MMKQKQHVQGASNKATVLSRPSTLYSSRSRQNVPSIVAQYSVGNIGEMVRKSTTAELETKHSSSLIDHISHALLILRSKTQSHWLKSLNVWSRR